MGCTFQANALVKNKAELTACCPTTHERSRVGFFGGQRTDEIAGSETLHLEILI